MCLILFDIVCICLLCATQCNQDLQVLLSPDCVAETKCLPDFHCDPVKKHVEPLKATGINEIRKKKATGIEVMG